MKRCAGFTLLEIMIVVAIIGLLTSMALPNFIKNRQVSQRNACAHSLRLIDAAKEQWALETGQVDGAPVVTDSINEYLRQNRSPICPANGTYNYQNFGTKPTCSISTHTGY